MLWIILICRSYRWQPVVIGLPVEITGSSVGIRAGGKLRQRKRYIKVKGLIKDLPDSLVIDISDLDIGQSVLAGDLKYSRVEVLELAAHLLSALYPQG